MRKTRALWFFFPPCALIIFLILFIVACLQYPGGSQDFPKQQGFSLLNNYYCDLLDDTALNGMSNAAAGISRWALGVLTAGLAVLWYQLPKLFPPQAWCNIISRALGFFSLGSLLFLRDNNHDLVLRLAGIFGASAIIFLLFRLYISGYRKAFAIGLTGLSLFLSNYLVYESGWAIAALPVLQKITIGVLLAWFAWLSLLVVKSRDLIGQQK